MTDFRKLAFVGLIGLGAASLACSSSNGTSGTGGSPGTGTGGSHTGGTSGTGTGGTSSGTGGAGTGGAGGAAGATLGCATSDPALSPEIATFSAADGGIASMYGTFVYGSGNPTPVFTIAGGVVNVTDTVQVPGGPYYQGFGVYLDGNAGGTDCVDGHTYTGIQFDMSGSLTGTGCTMQFSVNDSEHADMTASTDPKAAGPKGSYAPQLQIASMLTTATATIKVPFTGTGAPTGGSPSSGIDTTKLTGVQWQLSTPAAIDGGATECVWNFNIANVKFYQ